MKLPAEVIPLNRWCAYKAPLPENSPKSHTIIIVHRTEIDIKYFYVTSQVDKAKIRYRNDKDALVEIERSEWSEVLKEEKSCIQCGKGHLNCIDIKKFEDLYDNYKISYAGEIPKLIYYTKSEKSHKCLNNLYIRRTVYTNKRKITK